MYTSAIDKWDGHLPKINSGVLPFIDAKSLGNE
jgi:hypothetical protein